MKAKEKRQNFEGYKKFYKGLVNIFIIGLLGGMFAFFWMHFFNEYMDREFLGKGNIIFVVLYITVLGGLYKAYGATKIGYDRIVNVIISGILSILCTNILFCIQIQLMVANILYVWKILLDILLLIFLDIVINIILIYFFTIIYNNLFPAYNILEIYGNFENNLKKKLELRKDRYLIREEICYNEGMDYIFEKIKQYDAILLNDIPSKSKNDIIKYCFKISKRVYFTPKISDILVKGAGYINIFDSPLFLCRNIGLNFEQKALKRTFDIIVSLAGLILCMPLMLIVSLLIKAYDGGSVFFLQERCTIGGKVFSIYKFRSMIEDAEKDGKPQPATENDDRITPIGGFIRRTRIDELPQLFNILVGDMSLVGPRPERKENVIQYSEEIPEFEFRLKVKGGLTGFAQVYGKYNTTPYDKLKMDLQYITNYSILLDLQIILETIKIIFNKSSTEGFKNEDIDTKS